MTNSTSQSPKDSGLLMAHLAMLTVAIVYALNYYIMKGVLKAVPPFALLGVRIGSGLLFFAIITWGKWRFERKDWLRLIACGLFGVCMNQLFFIWGMSKTNPVNAGVIMTLTPVLVLLIAAIMRVERLTFLRSLGMLVAFCGALLLSLFGKKLAFGNDSVVGDMMIFINATSYAFYLVLVKPLVKKYPPMQLFAALFLVGSLLVLPIAGPAVLETNWTALPFDILLGVGYIILFTTIIAYTFNGWALKRVPSSQVGVYIYLQPMLVSMLSPWLLSDKLEPMQWLYIGLVLLGVMFVNWKKK